jgi:DNA-binding transcriptional LysR family regulator
MSPERSIGSINVEVALKELQAFVAIADLGSFRRAATELGYTQSALSHQVATLERKLGRRLFSRPGGRAAVQLTPAGEAAYRRARRALGEADAIMADIEAAERGERLRIRVGVSQTTASEIMPSALRDFREVHPGVEVILSEVDSDEALMSALGHGRLDLGFAHTTEPEDGIEAILVTEDPWVILTRRDSPIAEVEHPSFDVLDGIELVAWTRRWRGQRELEEAFGQRGIAPRIVYRTDDNVTLQRLVAAGLGDACVGYLSARLPIDSSVTWLIPHDQLSPRPVVLCYPRRRDLTPAVSALIAAIRARAPRTPSVAGRTARYG